MKRHLLVIDLQKQFKGSKYDACVNFVIKHKEDYDTVVATMFVGGNINFEKHLGWNKCKECNLDSLEFYTSDIKVIKKTGYGCDGDACVLMLCFQLWDIGYTNFRVLTDYIYTNAANITKDMYEEIMLRNFGDCII
jgi:hypothetical protein